MLPSIRLIAVTFCCGFLVVFAGLRLAAQLNGVHQAMPVMAANAAPVTVAAIADKDLRRGLPAVPMMYDLRFAVSTATPVSARPTTEAKAQIVTPLMILPPATEFLSAAVERQAEDITAESRAFEQAVPQTAPKPATVVIDVPMVEPAAVDLSYPQPVKANVKLAAAPLSPPAPRAVIDIPLIEPAIIDLTFSPAAKPEPLPVVAAVAPQQSQHPEPKPVLDIPLPEPAPVDLALSPPLKAEPDARVPSDIGHDSQFETNAHAKAEEKPEEKPLAVATLPSEDLIGTVKLPTKRIPLPRVRAEISEKPAAVTKPKLASKKPRQHRKPEATPQQADFEKFFGGQAAPLPAATQATLPGTTYQ